MDADRRDTDATRRVWIQPQTRTDADRRGPYRRGQAPTYRRRLTVFTSGSAMTMRDTLALRSPRSARVEPSIVVLRTRYYGPVTSTVVFVPNCWQQFSRPIKVFSVDVRTGPAQNVAAMAGSANRMSCELLSQTVMRPVKPGRTVMVRGPVHASPLNCMSVEWVC